MKIREKLEVIIEKINNFFKRIAGLYVDDGTLTAEYCWNYVRFGKEVGDISELAKEKIADIDSLIDYKIRKGNLEDDTILVKIEKSQADLYDEVEKYFKKAGFITLRINLTEINDSTYIIISWYNGGIKSEETSTSKK